MTKRRIIITGASGFIGQHTVAILQKYFDIETISLRDQKNRSHDLNGVDAILFLSGIAHQTSKVDQEIYFKVNKDLALELARKGKAHGVKQFVYMSSVKVYGNAPNQIFNELSTCEPDDAYGKSKREAEKELLALASAEFKIAVIRPAVVYGKGVKGNIRKLMELANKLPFLPFIGVNAQRSLVYIDNLVAMVKCILDQCASGIFIASDPPKTTFEMVREINLNLTSPKRMIQFPRFLKQVILLIKPGIYSRLFVEFIVDGHASNERLKFNPPVSFADGIKEMMRTETIVRT